MAVYNYIIETGVIVPDTSENLSEVQQLFLQTFGSDLVLNPETPQGILINLLTLGRNAVAENNAALANQINPNYAGGVFLDAILSLTGMQRNAQSYSFVLGNVTGVPGVTIPTSSIAALITGEQFSPVNSITLDAFGNGSGIFQALVSGPIITPVDTLTVIVSGPSGWETIINPSSGTVGSETQSDQQARYIRNVTLARQGTSLSESIISGLYAANIGVYSVKFRENYTNNTVVEDGVTLLPHSIYVNTTNNSPLNYTQVTAQFTGTPGTIIPQGSQASDGTVTYELISSVVLNISGNGTGVFQSLTTGSFNTAIGTLTTIVTPVSGWASVSNGQPSTVFSQDFLNGVAAALASKKSGGCNYNIGPGDPPYGGYVVPYQDPTSEQLGNVTFGTPTPIPILVQCTVTVTPQFVGDPITSVQNAIVTYALSQSGFLIGKDVSAFDLSNAVNMMLPGLSVTNMLIAIASAPSFSSNPIPINIWSQGTIVAGSITVFVTNSTILLI